MRGSLLQCSYVSLGSWLCKKAAAWKIDRTNRSSDRNFSYDNFSARSALSRSEKAILLVLERAEFLHNQGQKCPKRLRLPEHMGRIVPTVDIQVLNRAR
jgi:hypothetical protein